MKKLSIIALFALSLTSCMSTIMDDDYSHIDPKLQKYADSFVAEAAEHGVSIDTWNLKLVFGHNPTGAAGITDHSMTMIVIDTTVFNKSTNMEEVVYHEFGHLYLHREHTDDVLNVGDSKPVLKSLMGTKASIKYAIFPNRREYYISELFNPNTSNPEWAN